MAFTQDFRTQRRNYEDGETRIGELDRLWYDSGTNSIRIGDGETPGGVVVGGGAGGGDYTLPTASTTVKGGVKIDGTTIAITNQVIRVGTVPYSSLSGTPTIPTNNNELTNGAAYITSAALSGLATETYVTTRGYLTTVAYADVTGKPTLFSGSYTDLTDKPNIPSLTGYATETFVTTRGYLTSVGTISYNDLTDKPNLASTYTFNVAADDSTLRTISSEETVKFIGANGITTSSDAEGAITITASSSLINGNLSVVLNTDGSMTFPSNRIDGGANTIALWSSNQSSLVWRGEGGAGLPLQSVVQAREGLVNIGTTVGILAGAQTNYSWQFNTTGQMTFPDSTIQTTAWTGSSPTLTTARNINGVSFNGSADITVTAAAGTLTGTELKSTVVTSSLTSVGTLTNLSVTNTITGAVSGNAGTATKLATARAINGVDFDGSAAITVTAAAGTLSGNTLASGVLSSSLTSVGTLTGLTTSGAASITYTPGTATGVALTATGKDTIGGTGYFDFLRATNTTSGVANGTKTFRLNNTGAIEIINSAYSATIFSLSDAGAFSVPGPILVSGKQAVNGPAFRAYVDTGQTINSGSQQTVAFGTENFDTNGCFASSTFTPTVEGYYQFNATVRIDGPASTGECMIVLYKNAGEYARGNNQSGTEQGASFYSMQVSDIAYANGTTDSFHIRIQQTSGSNRNTTAGSPISYFSGCMIRGA